MGHNKIRLDKLKGEMGMETKKVIALCIVCSLITGLICFQVGGWAGIERGKQDLLYQINSEFREEGEGVIRYLKGTDVKCFHYREKK